MRKRPPVGMKTITLVAPVSHPTKALVIGLCNCWGVAYSYSGHTKTFHLEDPFKYVEMTPFMVRVREVMQEEFSYLGNDFNFSWDTVKLKR